MNFVMYVRLFLRRCVTRNFLPIFLLFVFASFFAASLPEMSAAKSGKKDSAKYAAKRLAARVKRNVDASPLPNYITDFVSLGMGGRWCCQSRTSQFVSASTVEDNQTPESNCSKEAIIYYADRAPSVFQKEKKGLLYGVRTHTKATRVDDMPGYNSCALVVYAILKKAGCRWMRRTANAKSIYDMAYKRGWRPSTVQNGGCLVAWNSRWEGKRARIGRGAHVDPTKKRGVLFRHIGITTGPWVSVDNTAIYSEPSAFIMVRPIRYDPPMYLCPPKHVQSEINIKRKSRKKIKKRK